MRKGIKATIVFIITMLYVILGELAMNLNILVSWESWAWGAGVAILFLLLMIALNELDDD